MPAKLLKSIGFNQKGVYSIHLLMYGTPVLTFLQVTTEEYNWLFNAFERRVFNDWDFLIGLSLAVLFDTLTGGIASILKKEFSGRALYKKLGTKVFGICVSVACIGLMKNTLINGESNLMSYVVDAGFYSVMLGFEGASVLKNCYKIYPWPPIKLVLAKLEIFYNKKTGEIVDELPKEE